MTKRQVYVSSTEERNTSKATTGANAVELDSNEKTIIHAVDVHVVEEGSIVKDADEPNDVKTSQLRTIPFNVWMVLCIIVISGAIMGTALFLKIRSPKTGHVSEPPAFSDAKFLQIQIPVDRAFDVQWNPPGYPSLDVSYLQPPFFDHEEDRDGFYTFEMKENGKVGGFVRKRSDGSVLQIFEEVQFISISEDVLMFNGNPHGDNLPLGGGYGTIIKAPSTPAGDVDGSWSTEPVASSEMSAEEWLVKNFQMSSTTSPTASPLPIMQESELLQIQIPVDRAFDVQWNPPGYPSLDVFYLQPPFFDDEEDRNGFYTFEMKENGKVGGFVRKRSDGSVLQIFEEVEFISMSEDVLMFNGNPHGDNLPLGGGYGTIIKAPSIPAGDVDGSWSTEPVAGSEMSAEEWLTNNF